MSLCTGSGVPPSPGRCLLLQREIKQTGEVLGAQESEAAQSVWDLPPGEGTEWQ